jgi:predicted dehydrogenase
MHDFIKEGKIGRIFSYRVECGSYLPNWRPHLDYRKNYGAQAAQGGGVILDNIHEIDYARWIFGDPLEVIGVFGKVSALEIDTEDLAEIILSHDRMVGNIHLDYLSKRYTRMIHAIGEDGDLLWEWHRNGMAHFDNERKKETVYPIPENYDLNQMYLDEMKYFLNCVAEKTETFFSFKEARRVLEIALAVKESSLKRRPVVLSRSSGVLKG